jgi:hypothetical protein
VTGLLNTKQGYNVAKEVFNEIIKKVKAREASESKLTNAIVQTDPTTFSSTSVTSQAWTFVENGIGTRSAPTVDISVQTSPKTAFPTSYLTSGTQTNHPDINSHPMMDCFVQTNPSSIQTSCHIIKSSSLSPVTPSVSTTTMGIQTDTTTTQLLKTNPPTCVAMSQCP